MRFNRQGLAWNQEQGERRRLFVIAGLIGPLFLLLAGYITWTTLPPVQRAEQEALPPQLARLVLEKKQPPKPVVEKKEEKKPEPEPEPEPQPQVAEKPKPEPKPEPVKPEPKPEPKPKPTIVKKPAPAPAEVEQAREKVKSTGILAMSDELSKLSALANSVQLDAPQTMTAKPIARKQTDNLAARASSAATARSGGIDPTQLNQQTGEVTLSERKRAKVEQAEQVVAAVEAEERVARSNDAQRTKEEVRRTMDANKSAIYSIYSRALRKQPSLRGSITPELVIEQSGTVSRCSVVESSLNEPSLEEKICNRLRLVNFGAQPGVSQTTVRYPIELLPG